MFELELFSIILGFLGCFFLILSFIFQLYKIYESKSAEGTSWGLIISQILTCLLLGSSAGINVYLDGIINLPFLVANGSLFILFLVMSYLKIIYEK
tara:strand:+ start:306 stop:593 length:288 start_codon:yes stop_codon:yes gene_type:complete